MNRVIEILENTREDFASHGSDVEILIIVSEKNFQNKFDESGKKRLLIQGKNKNRTNKGQKMIVNRSNVYG